MKLLLAPGWQDVTRHLPIPIALYFFLLPSGPLASQQACDLSAVSEVTAPVVADPAPVPGPPGAMHHEISIPESCPKETGAGGNVMPNGDGDGDGNADDRQLDINGTETGSAEQAPNGNVELWCINPSASPVGGYYSLQFDPAGAAGPRFVGKCPFTSGWNLGWKFIDPRTARIVELQWQSEDHGADDDGDGTLDTWVYRYNPAADTVEQKHFEDGTEQADGANPAPPPERPFGFGDLLPKNPRVDDPDPTTSSAPEGNMDGLRPRLPLGRSETLVITTGVANDGPCLSGPARVLLEVEAPSGCTVDGSPGVVRDHVLEVSIDLVALLEDAFEVRCDAEGVFVFTLRTSVVPAVPGILDPEPSDDQTAGTFTVEIFADVIPTLSPWGAAALAVLLLLAAWGALAVQRRRRL